MNKSNGIGRAGEQTFDKWARAAGCHSVKPDPDELGVDRMFEIPVRLDGSVDLDAAPPPAHGWVQIKTSRRRRMTEPIKLDICRRFVVTDAPAFFLRLVIDEDEAPREAYIAHVDEALGARILEELRRVDDGTPEAAAQLHRQQLTLRWTSEDAVDLGGPAVFARLGELIGDPSTYAARKKAWRETVGYPERASTIRFRASAEAVARHLLGEVPELTATIADAKTSRFGIERPMRRLIGPDRTVLMGCADGDPCTLRLKRDGRCIDVPGRFWTPLKAMDAPPSGIDAWRFRGGLLELRGQEGHSVLRAGLADGVVASLAAWRASAEAAAALTDGTEWELWLGLSETMCRLGGMRGDAAELSVGATERATTHAITAAAFAAEAGIPETAEISAEMLEDRHATRAFFMDVVRDRDLQVELPLPPETLAKLPPEVPVVLTATCWGMLDDRHAVCAVTTEPVPWKRTPSIIAFSANIAERTRIEAVRGAKRALEVVERLTATAREKDLGPKVLHIVCTDHPELRELARARPR